MNQQKKDTFNHFFQHSLNPTQQEVVSPEKGILLVRAGAGSGKTRVITARMANLIVNCQAPASSIVALTFTNKAAREMKERITKFIGSDGQMPYVGTFHSYCLRLLKSNPAFISFPNFSILDQEDQEKIVRRILNKFGLLKKVTPRQVISYVSRIKNENIDATNFQDSDPLMQQLFLEYEKEKTIAQSFDFDDLLHEVHKLFKSNTLFKEKFQHYIKHILVDEYQDTNLIQHGLLKQMTQNNDGKFILDSLCVVGDEDQSIYSWRGATVANIVEFKKDFPDAYTVTVEQNYRSVQPILHVANEIISYNTYRAPKKLFSIKTAHDRIRLLSLVSGYQEAEAIALFLKINKEKQPLKEFAILYRSHYQSRILEEALIRHAVPYKILGGTQFYEREEIKDLLCHMRLLVNPFDRIAFLRVINCPTRGLGDKFQEVFYQLWDRNPFLPFYEIAKLMLNEGTLTKNKQESLEEFLSLFNNITALDKPSKVLEYFVKKTNYVNYLQTNYEKEIADTKIDNVKELLNGISFSEEKGVQTLAHFLEDVALLQEKNNAAENDFECVRLMTFHAAKGLEFNTIILCGLEEGILPSAHSRFQAESIEEERRLLYVGITRACERLLLTYARYRYTFGQMAEQRASRFIKELAMSYITHHDCSYWNTQQFVHYFQDWSIANNKTSINTIDTIPSIRTEKTHLIPDIPDKHSNINKSFQLYQAVTHTLFGKGIIEKIEEKNSEKTYLTIRFPVGIKKISSNFVQSS